MAEYKDQHWLPYSYLRGFAHTKNFKRRKAKLYRWNPRSRTEDVRAVKQCTREWTYSQARAEEAEKSWWEMENNWSPTLRGKSPGGQLSLRDQGTLGIQALTLWLRNGHLPNGSGVERFMAYEAASAQLLAHLGDYEAGQTAVEDAARRFVARWGSVLLGSNSSPFMTCDHPVLAFGSNQGVEFVGVPATPNLFLLCYRRDLFTVSSTQAVDGNHINALVWQSAERYVFSSRPLESGEEKEATQRFANTFPRFVLTGEGLTGRFLKPNEALRQVFPCLKRV